jgi:hypothetical protein
MNSNDVINELLKQLAINSGLGDSFLGTLGDDKNTEEMKTVCTEEEWTNFCEEMGLEDGGAHE